METQITMALVALITAALSYGLVILNKKLNGVKDEDVRRALSEMVGITSDVVTAVGATVIKDLKADNDGVLDKDEAIAVRDSAVMMILDTLTTKSHNILVDNIADLEMKIQVQIENEIEDNK